MNLFELNSFVLKFRHLSSVGYDAALNISSKNGRTSISLTADIGILPTPCPVPPPTSKSTASNSTACNDGSTRSRGPAYKRRQDRRQCLQDSKLSAQTDTEQVSDASRSVNATVNTTEEVGNIVNTNTTEEVAHILEVDTTQEDEDGSKPSDINLGAIRKSKFNYIPHSSVPYNKEKIDFANTRISQVQVQEISKSVNTILNPPTDLTKQAVIPSDCCLHDCRNDGDHPPDGKCCYHRCRIGVKQKI